MAVGELTATRTIAVRVVDGGGRHLQRHEAPLTWGMPLPRGWSHSTTRWTLRTAAGARLPLQARVLERWADASIRWALLDTQITTTVPGPLETLLDPDGDTAPDAPPLIQPGDGGLDVHTGAARFTVSTDAPLGLSAVEVHGVPVLDAGSAGLRLVTDGGPDTIRWRSAVIEENGPLRASVRLDGDAFDDRTADFHLVLRMHFFRGLPVARVRLTIRNPRRAAHPAGRWELGDPGSRFIRELTVVLPRSDQWLPARLACSLEPGRAAEAAHRTVAVYQDSSGGEHWAGTVHVNRHGVVPARFRGYRLSIDGHEGEGRRATPIVVLDGGPVQIAATCPEFWQNCPRAIAADRNAVTIGLFPAQYADLHELQGGEQKTHEYWIAFGPDPVTEVPLDWCRSSLVAAATPDWYAVAGALPYLTPAGRNGHADYDTLVAAAVDGPDSFFQKRERVDEFGWRHFGDIYADHEAVKHPGAPPLVSHYNNQYDAVAGFACQFMRTGDVRWWTQCRDLAAHVVDIDIYHTDQDKSAYNHGLFWHTVHYLDAGRSTHRSYPRAEGSNGGGPGAEHNYTTGLLLHHLLTGDPVTRDAVLELAGFVVSMDDGRRSAFRWLDRGDTGLATASRTPLYHGPGRGAGNSLNALIDGHRLSGDRRFLVKAEQIIRRCVHPQQAIEPLGLLDRENRWFYTMFLEALGRYLDHKNELGEIDAMYAYARASLLHYARWMAAHEYPYLDRPDELEFPTETWAAQDLRKSDVFGYAALHASPAERPGFVERAAFYFHDATARLAGLPTRTLARPIILLLGHGFLNAWLDRQPEAALPRPSATACFDPPPPAFVPQKVRARRRAVGALVISGLLALAAGVLLIVASRP